MLIFVSSICLANMFVCLLPGNKGRRKGGGRGGRTRKEAEVIGPRDESGEERADDEEGVTDMHETNSRSLK